ncbi:MAG: endo-1,4-beta-xylanase [Sedimentisphaerales bacterium]|nr:endo-1,4-beta-xylanase [Sedimentisphaerales bacterium]
MIRFKVFQNGSVPNKMALNGAYLFAQDEIPVRGQLEYKQGELLGVRHSDTPVGLSTLWEIGDFGKIFLQTTRLPERVQPYNLNVEIARARLLRISQKREDWGIADLNLTDEERALIDDALDKFTAALCHLDEPETAARYADESLGLAMRGGEVMTLAHARMFLERRNSTQGFGRHSFGCCLDPLRIREPHYQKFIKENFHFVTIPMSWRHLEPKEQEKNFQLLDECVTWLYKNRIAVKVGPLVNFSPVSIPDWLFIWEHDFEQVREMAYDFITSVVERYGSKVQAWDVISGMNVDNCFKFSFDQILEMTRSTALAAKRASPRSLVLIELKEPWGEYYAVNQRTVPPMIYADMVSQSGVPFDGYGIKIRFGRGGGGMHARDMLELSSLLDRFAVFGKPVHLASVQVPSKADTRDDTSQIGEAGYWHGQWNEQIQADWLDQAYTIALSKPYVETVTWEDLIDTPHAMLQFGGLNKADLSPKPAFEKLRQMKNSLVRAERKSTKSKK